MPLPIMQRMQRATTRVAPTRGWRYREHSMYELKMIQYIGGDRVVPTATLIISTSQGELISSTEHGDGPVDAVYNCINRMTDLDLKLKYYSVHVIDSGSGAPVKVRVTVEFERVEYTGEGEHTDIVHASAIAYISAINNIH